MAIVGLVLLFKTGISNQASGQVAIRTGVTGQNFNNVAAYRQGQAPQPVEYANRVNTAAQNSATAPGQTVTVRDYSGTTTPGYQINSQQPDYSRVSNNYRPGNTASNRDDVSSYREGQAPQPQEYSQRIAQASSGSQSQVYGSY